MKKPRVAHLLKNTVGTHPSSIGDYTARRMLQQLCPAHPLYFKTKVKYSDFAGVTSKTNLGPSVDS